MARRKRKWHPIGHWLRTARKDAGLSLTELGQLTSVSTSALGRFESDRAVPSFDDVCLIARQLGWPLLYFATGRERTGNDELALTAQLYYWGLRDVILAERLLIGEVQPFEILAATVVGGEPSPRIVEAIPGLLLRNKFEAHELISNAGRYGSLRRVGWLADVAESISERVPREYLQPDVRRWLHAVKSAATGEDQLARDEIDYVSLPVTGRSPTKLRERAWALSPPLTRRWGIACDITLEQFLERALSVLQATYRGTR